jgi:hypothetical protein
MGFATLTERYRSCLPGGSGSRKTKETVSFFGLSSFLIFIGIYSSAFSVSEDSELRKSIRRYAIKESKVTRQYWNGANGERDIEKSILVFTKRN